MRNGRVGVAKDDGDEGQVDFGRREREEDGEDVVYAWVGVEDDFVRHGLCLFLVSGVCVCVYWYGNVRKKRMANEAAIIQKKVDRSEHLGKGGNLHSPPNPPFNFPCRLFASIRINNTVLELCFKGKNKNKTVIHNTPHSIMPKDTASSLLAHILDNTQIPHQPLLILRDEPTFPATPIFNHLLATAVSRYVRKT